MAAVREKQQPDVAPAALATDAKPAPTITPEQIAMVKSTAPLLKEHGLTITTIFYKDIIGAHPELHNVFSMTSQATGAQPRALAKAVLAYATYIDDLPKLSHAVSRIAHKHVSLHIRPDQYDMVGRHLIAAIGRVLGDAATPAIVDSWVAAYGVLADVFIGVESKMYGEHRDWLGFRKFRVLRKEAEAESITSFYLTPSDARTPLPKFLPGQYVSVQLFVPELGYLQSRQYSLSEAHRQGGEYYRVSVKREEGVQVGNPGGVISKMLHEKIDVGDEVEVSHPQGEFFVDPADESKAGAPLVLLSAGVGATPLLSILESVTVAYEVPPAAATRPLSWIHASRSRAQRPFEARVTEIQKAVGEDRLKTRLLLFLGTVGPKKDGAKDHPHFGGGKMDLAKLDAEKDLYTSDPRAEYYLCGPEAWMLNIREKLEQMGVAHHRIRLELFATGDVQ